MDKKMMAFSAVLVVLVVAVAGIFLVMDKDETQAPVAMDEAELKVFGNVNGDRFIDKKDLSELKQLVADEKTAEEYPLADANYDGVLDSKDVEVVEKIIAGEDTVIWHVNQYDENQDGVVEDTIASTKYPIRSFITMGTGNNLLMFYALGITEELKGATYTSSADVALYGDLYRDESKVANIGKSIVEIPFEDGKVGSSDIIAKEGVTAVIANQNKGSLPNWKTFEDANIDVVRIAASSAEKDKLVHSTMLLGLLFQKSAEADAYVDLSYEILDFVTEKTKNAYPVSAVSSSMTGYLSVGDSDYRDYITLVGASYGLDGYSFGNKVSIIAKDYPEVYTYDIDRIIHVRSGVTYGQTEKTNMDAWNTYTKAFKDWKNAESGQYVISSSLPVPLRVAYIACAMYPDLVDINEVDKFHQRFMDEIFKNDKIDISGMKFILTAETMA